ncbi:hypothetical protein A2U01_0067891, partial [Trifolium medium]|nr:hypothetical protein [Trifolium medium]
PHFEDADWSR